MGQEMDREEVFQMIAAHDIKGDGVLSYEEFKCIFFDKTTLDDEGEQDQPFGKDGPTVDQV